MGRAEARLERGQGPETARNSEALWKEKTEEDLRKFLLSLQLVMERTSF